MSSEIKVCTADAPKLKPEDLFKAAVAETMENLATVIPGTRVGNTSQDGRLAGVILTGKKWANGRVLRISFGPAHAHVVTRTQRYFREIEQYVNLKFFFVPHGEDAEVRVAFNLGDGSWSYLGTDCLTIPKNQPTMNFGWLTPESAEEEYSRVVLHEVGHMLGMPHEHQHPRAGIPWDEEAVYRYYGGPPNNWTREQTNHNLFKKYSETITQFSEFDRDSIMLYAIPNQLTVGDWQVGWNRTLSATDKRFLREQYPVATVPPPPPPPPPPPVKDCGEKPSLGDYMRAWWASGRNISLSQTMKVYHADNRRYRECKAQGILARIGR